MAEMTEAEQVAQEIVVFDGPHGLFSNDPRWNDSRVREAWEAKQNKGESKSEAPVTEVDEDPELPPYEQWNNEDLRAELSDRGLSVDGKKAEMVKRLEEDDAKAEV